MAHVTPLLAAEVVLGDKLYLKLFLILKTFSYFLNGAPFRKYGLPFFVCFLFVVIDILILSEGK